MEKEPQSLIDFLKDYFLVDEEDMEDYEHFDPYENYDFPDEEGEDE